MAPTDYNYAILAKMPSSHLTPPPARKQRPSVSIGFVNGMISGFPRIGRVADAILQDVEIAKEQLHHPHARIALPRYAALYRRICEALGEEGFALFSRPIKPGSFEFLCRAVISAPTLEVALVRAGRLLDLLVDDLQVRLERTAEHAVLHIEERPSLPVTGAPRVFAYEWLLRLLHGLGAWLVARPLPMEAACFPYPRPSHSADYARIFAPQCEFDAPRLSARFPSAVLDWPLRRDEAALTEYLKEAPASITTLYQDDQALAPRVRAALKAALPEIRPLTELAHTLFMSPRTLHRRLAEEGTRYQVLLDEIREELAIAWLTKTQRPLQQIAADLGYTDAAVFYRAFRNRLGIGPRAYRLARQTAPASKV